MTSFNRGEGGPGPLGPPLDPLESLKNNRKEKRRESTQIKNNLGLLIWRIVNSLQQEKLNRYIELTKAKKAFNGQIFLSCSFQSHESDFSVTACNHSLPN